MIIEYVSYSPRIAPTGELKDLVARFRPVFGNEAHIRFNERYGALTRMYREIEVKEERTPPRKRDKRRLTKLEIDAGVLDAQLIADLKSFSV